MLIQELVKLDDANFVEQRLYAAKRIAVQLAPVRTVSAQGSAVAIGQ